MAKEKATKPKGQEPHLPGMEPVEIAEISAAGEAYETARDARIEASEAEDETHKALLSVMHKHGRAAYRSPDGLLITIKPGREKCKVQRVPAAEQKAA